MKRVYLVIVAVIVSFVLLQSAEARGSRSFGSVPHFSAPAYHYSAPSRSFSSAPRSNFSGPRFNSTARFSSAPRFQNRHYTTMAPRFSGTNALRNPTYVSNRARFAGDRTTAFNSRSFARSNAQLAVGNRTVANRTRAFSQDRVIARYSANRWNRHWDRSRDHWWRGHRCHFRNGFWFIYDPWPFYPYGYGFYPYSTYYDASYYDDSYYGPNEYADTTQSEYAVDSQVSDVQSALAREGYYDGAIDGKLGPATRNALRRYQREHGLEATGGINQAVINALRLR